MTRGPAHLAGHSLLRTTSQIFKNLLLALLHFEKNWLRESRIVMRRMNLTGLQKDRPQIGNALLSQ